MKTRIGLISLGCPKNLVDSEEMLGALVETGQAEITNDARHADVLVVNTCAFIESAKQESVAAILDAVKRKKRGQVQKVIVTGCLAQRYGDNLATEIPEVDAYLGIQSAPQIASVVFHTASVRSQKTVLPMASNHQVQPLSDRYPLIPPTRVQATAPWTAYVKISEGCDHGCTFCSIPAFRGRHRSKPMEQVVAEVTRLAAAGVQEVVLIAQDTTAYGMDLYKELALARLIERLGTVAGIRWVRLLYCYPTMLTDRLIKTMRDTPNVAHYVDVPLQHGDDTMLARMKRGGSVLSYYRMLERLRSAMPEVAVRTTFLVGFPGEDEAAFANLKTFVQEARFDRLGVFEYSPEDGTPGFAMEPRVPKKVAARRRRELMETQQPLALALNRRLVGREFTVLVEGRRDGQWLARSWRDAPEIDGQVFVSGEKEKMKPGDWVTVRVSEAHPYDLSAVII
jgi:ribosomal protein S12 methylthiotransferase